MSNMPHGAAARRSTLLRPESRYGNETLSMGPTWLPTAL